MVIRIVLLCSLILYTASIAAFVSEEPADVKSSLTSLRTLQTTLKSTLEKLSQQARTLKVRLKLPSLVQRLQGTKAPIVNLGKSLALDPYGYPTLNALQVLLEMDWPSLKPITVKKVSGGAFTGAIFAASSNGKPVFFLKVSNKNGEEIWKNLDKINKSQIGRLGLKAAHSTLYKAQGIDAQHLPIITNVEKFYTYQNVFKKSLTLEVTHAAQGQSVYDVITNPHSTPTQMQQCAQTMGKALSSFHQAFMTYGNDKDPKTWRTVIHADIHPNNAFFNEAFSRIYFIDNETMIHALHKRALIDWDLVNFIFTPIMYWSWIVSCSDVEWEKIVTFYHVFIQAYIHTYPAEKQPALTSYIRDIINQRVTLANDLIHGVAGNLHSRLMSLANEPTPPYFNNEYQCLFPKVLDLNWRTIYDWDSTKTISTYRDTVPAKKIKDRFEGLKKLVP